MLHAAGPRPYYKALEAYTKRTWKNVGNFSILSGKNGFFIIRFLNELIVIISLKREPGSLTRIGL